MVRKRDPRLAAHRPYVRAPIAEPITVERAVEEGLLIARSALTMEVKNRIIVSAVRDNNTFDATEAATWVAHELKHLAREQAEYAKRMNQLAVEVTGARGPSQHSHDYGPRDFRLLTRRGMAYAALSTDLERLVDDPGFVTGVVEDARIQAWAELGTAIEARLALAPAEVSAGPGYEDGRDKRLRSFIEVDLANLAALSGAEY
jgi:hypothetical protein